MDLTAFSAVKTDPDDKDNDIRDEIRVSRPDHADPHPDNEYPVEEKVQKGIGQRDIKRHP